MDIYDGADWTEMDIDDLKAAVESGSSIEEAAQFLCPRIASTTSPARAKSWGLSRKQTRRREPAPSPLIVPDAQQRAVAGF